MGYDHPEAQAMLGKRFRRMATIYKVISANKLAVSGKIQIVGREEYSNRIYTCLSDSDEIAFLMPEAPRPQTKAERRNTKAIELEKVLAGKELEISYLKSTLQQLQQETDLLRAENKLHTNRINADQSRVNQVGTIIASAQASEKSARRQLENLQQEMATKSNEVNEQAVIITQLREENKKLRAENDALIPHSEKQTAAKPIGKFNLLEVD